MNNNPEIILVTGGVCAGKSTYIKEQIPEDYVSIDAGDIFIELSKGEYYDFPSHLEDEMNHIGQEKLKNALVERKNIILELIGNDKSLMTELVGFLKKIGYKVKLIKLTCDIEVAMERNDNRPDDNISSYFTEPYHFEWFRNAEKRFNKEFDKEAETTKEVKTISFTNEGEIKSSKVKAAVYNRIDFDLPVDLWDKIDDLFAECWNDVIGLRGVIHENQIEQYIYNGLKKEKIIFPYDKVSKIVGIILDYIKMTGGFLKEDE